MQLQYWLSPDAPDPEAFALARAGYYLTFDVDPGGLNNVRMAFEYVAVVAALTGRTLVLPPSQPWYLLHSGPIHTGARGGSCGFADIFDIDALSRSVSTISTAAFIRDEGARLGIPQDAAGFPAGAIARDAAPLPAEDLRRWKRWLFENAHVVPWSPNDALICLPNVETVLRGDVLTEPIVDRRELVEFSPAMREAPVIHFPARSPYRQLGQVATMLASADPSLATNVRRLLKHNVRYVPRVFEVAGKLAATLPRDGYSCLHVRRNDFQFRGSRADAKESLGNIRALLKDGEPLYVATDETDEAFLDVLGEDRPVYRWADHMSARCAEIFGRDALPDELVGPVEQVICATGRVFVGTELSTFSNYVTRLRGYMGATDRGAYFHTNRHDPAAAGTSTLVPRRGRDYLHEWPILWEGL